MTDMEGEFFLVDLFEARHEAEQNDVEGQKLIVFFQYPPRARRGLS